MSFSFTLVKTSLNYKKNQSPRDVSFNKGPWEQRNNNVYVRHNTMTGAVYDSVHNNV